jgi:hypothetical protein
VRFPVGFGGVEHGADLVEQRGRQRVQLLGPVERVNADAALLLVEQDERQGAYPFTAPAVRPATNWRCRKKKTSISGSDTMTELAINSP